MIKALILVVMERPGPAIAAILVWLLCAVGIDLASAQEPIVPVVEEACPPCPPCAAGPTPEQQVAVKQALQAIEAAEAAPPVEAK